MEPVECGNCKEPLNKNKVIINYIDKTGVDIMIYCPHCKNNNHISLGAPYIYTWEKED